MVMKLGRAGFGEERCFLGNDGVQRRVRDGEEEGGIENGKE